MRLKPAWILGAVVFGGPSPSVADISIVNVTGSRGPVEIAMEPLAEDVTSMGDQIHQYNGIPSSLIGTKYLRVRDEDATSVDYALTVNVELPGVLLLFLDNRIGDGLGGTSPRTSLDDPPSLGVGAPRPNPMGWVAGQEFVDAGIDIGIDESGDGSIDNTSSVFARYVQPGIITLGAQSTVGGTHMYGVAFIPERPVAIFAAQPDSVTRGFPCTLCWLVKPGTTVAIDGIGDVTGRTQHGWGTIVVTPVETTTYTLTTSSGAEFASATTTVVVTTVDGLVGWWPLDEADGSVAHDVSGFDVHGVILTTSRDDPQLSSGSYHWEAQGGRFGGALFLDGVGGGGEVIDIGYGPRVEVRDSESFEFLAGHSFTVALWYKSDTIEDNQGLVTKGYDTRRASNYWQLQTRASSFAYDSRPTLAGDPRSRIDSTSGISHADNTWHHFVVVRDTGLAEFRLIVDGVNVTRYAFAEHAPNDGAWNVGANDRGLMFGTHLNRFTRGWFDEIAIWRRALSSVEIETIFSRGVQALAAIGNPEVTGVSIDLIEHQVTISWTSRPGKSYALTESVDLFRWFDLDKNILSQGRQTTIEVQSLPELATRFFRVREN